MQVSLEAIKFNYDPDSATMDALNLRRNETEAVAIPEWRNGVSILADHSPVAYAINATKGHQIKIKAKFNCVNPKIRTVEVRAIDPARNLEAFSISEGNAIGEVAGREIRFDTNGETDYESFDLINVDIHNRGVSSSITTLVWQCRLRPSDNWSFMRTTYHRIYTILDVPHCAWRQQPFDGRNVQLPWSEVLDYSCEWASGAKDLDEAAGKITQAVFDLGKSLVVYDGPSSYADLSFDCASLLSLFRDDKGLGQRLNCSDCATIVSTFANALGCDLWQSRIGSRVFVTNPIRLIGSSSFDRLDFNYHEVAWKDECSFNNVLFDACLELDADENPSEPPQTGVLAIQTIFGTTAKGNYRFRLAPPPKRGQPDGCQPTPEKRRRRSIGLNTPPQTDCTTNPLSDNGPSAAQPYEAADKGPPLLNGNTSIGPWRLYRTRFLQRANLLFGAYSLWFVPDGDPEQLIRLDYYELGSHQAASLEKQRLLERYQVRNSRQDLTLTTFSNIEFIIVTDRALLGQAGFVVIEVRSIGRKEIDISEFAKIASQMINQSLHAHGS